MNLKSAKILITGANGFLGSHTVDIFKSKNIENLITFSSKEFDLTKESEVQKLFKTHTDVDIVIHIAADIGGIKYSSTYPAQQFYNNTMMNTLILHYSYLNKVKKFTLNIVFNGCSYSNSPTTPLLYQKFLIIFNYL